MKPITLALLTITALTLTLHAQETQKKPAPATRPAVEINLAEPQTALKSFFLADQALDLPSIKKTIHISDPKKEPLVDVTLKYNLWAHYLERQAVIKFGPKDGITVLSHVRSFDDQLAIDIKRAVSANVDYNTAKTTANLFLQPDKNRPEGLEVGSPGFLDNYKLIKIGNEWKIDYLKTFSLDDPEKENEYRLNAALFPKIATAMKALSDQIKDGKIREASEAKNALEAAWTSALPSDDPK